MKVIHLSEETVNKIRGFITKMQLKFHYEEENKRFVLPYVVSDKNFSVYVVVEEPWMTIVALLVNADDLPVNINKELLYARLLQDNYYFNEVTFGLTRRGDIIVHAEIHGSALTYENFTVEFGSVVYGITHFIDKIMKEFPLKTSETSKLYV